MANENKTKTTEDILFTNDGRPISDQIDRVFSQSGSGSLDSAITNNYWGVNHRQQPGAMSINRDYYGLTFFTRPNLNLSTENIRATRILSPLLNNNSSSTQRIIRSILDPELAWANPPINCPNIDPNFPFITILTNQLISMSGWPDQTIDSYTSPEGIYREVWSMADSIVDNYAAYSITANFRNIQGDPITKLFHYWLHYMAKAYIGTIVPYPDVLLNHEIDYQTRIYRLVLDENKQYVTNIAACGAAYPESNPLGAKFNYEMDRPLNDANHQVSVTFKAIGAIYNDDILIDEFNETVFTFNESMSDRYRAQYYRKIKMDEIIAFNNRGYPRINPETMELEWWVSAQDYQERYSLLLK